MADLIFLIQQKNALLLHDPGCGKTPTVCVNQYRRAMTGIGRTIWSQPKALMAKNKQELLEFTDFKDKDVQIVDGTRAQVDAAMRSDAAVLIMGAARFQLVANDVPPEYNCHDVDEIHMTYGGGTSKRTGAFLQHRTIESTMMSGTLINGRLDSAWPAIHKINPKYYPLGLDSFMNYHALCDENGKVAFWRNHSKLSGIFAKHGLRRTFEEIHGKQSVVIQVEEVELSPRQRKRYEEFEEKALIELDDVIIDGIESGALSRARQIMEHPRQFHDPRHPGEYIDIVDGELTAKEEALLIHLEDHTRTGKPLIIFSSLVQQQHELLRIVQKAGLTACLMNSVATAKQRGEMDTGFVRGDYQVMIGSSQIANVGFNWQFWGPKRVEVDHVIFASTNFLDGDFGQAFKRVIRQNRITPLRVTVQRYMNTVERKIHGIICRKSREANKVDPHRQVFTFA
jgi:hypothetical protein